MYKKVSQKTKYILRIRAFIIAFLFAMVIALFVPKESLLFLMLTALWVVSFTLYICLYLPIRQANTFYSISQTVFCLNSGVIYYTTKTIYLERVQYVATKASPLEKIFGVVTLIIYAPGGKIVISSIDKSDAPKIVQNLCCFTKKIPKEGEGSSRE